jgi:hypothetical protein
VAFIDGSAFSNLENFSLSIETGNRTFSVESDFLFDLSKSKIIRYFGSKSTIVIPRYVEKLGSKCFHWSDSVSSVTFESNSQSKRIESCAFSSSSLKSIVIPRSVTFIDGSAFSNLESLSLSIETENRTFCVDGDFLFDFSKSTLICYFGSQKSVTIPHHVETLGPRCFSLLTSLSSISFETESQLKRIEPHAFSSSSLKSIVIPRSVIFIDGSAFSSLENFSLSIETGNGTFFVDGDFLFDLSKATIIRYFRSQSSIVIPRDVEILGSKCFYCADSVSSISFESNSRMKRIESEAFYESSLQSIVVPQIVEILGSKCFFGCKSLSSLSFESDSQLKRIESEAFCESSLQSIVIPRSVSFIEGSAFSNLKGFSLSLESETSAFSVDGDFLFNLSKSTLICYFGSKSSIVIPQNVEIIGSKCFSRHCSLSSISFESNSQLRNIESRSFADTGIHSIVLPSQVSLIAGDAFPADCSVSLAGNSCPAFDEWNSLRMGGSSRDFERKQEPPSRSHLVSDFVADFSSFEIVRALSDNSRVPVEILVDRATGFQIAMKSFPLLSQNEEGIFWREVDALVRLEHRCIVPFFGFMLQVRLNGPRIATHFMQGGSLQSVLASPPSWWTGTAKSIVVAGIAFGMAFTHECGIIHRDLKPSNILLDEKHRPRICDFGSSRDQSLSRTVTGMVGTPLYMAPELYDDVDYDGKVDVFSFSLILYEIVVGHPVFSAQLSLGQLALKVAKGMRADIPAAVKSFVARLIRRGWSANPAERPSFTEIVEELRSHSFCVVRDGFNCEEVTSYVRWINVPGGGQD